MNKRHYLILGCFLFLFSTIVGATIQSECDPSKANAHQVYVCPVIMVTIEELAEFAPPQPTVETSEVTLDLNNLSVDLGTNNNNNNTNNTTSNWPPSTW